MATVIDALVLTLGLDATNFRQGQKQTSEDLRRTEQEANAAAKSIEASGKTAAQFFSRLKLEALGFIGALVGARGIEQFVVNLTNGDAAIGRMARNLGMASQDLGAWQLAAEQAGGSAQGITSAMLGMQQQMEQYRLTGEAGPGIIWLRTLGIAAFDAAGRVRNAGDVLSDVLDRLHDRSPEERLAIGTNLGLDIGTIQLANLSHAERERLLAQQRANAPTEADAARAIALGNAFRNLANDTREFGREIFNGASPAVTELLGAMDRWVRANREWIATRVVEAIKEFVTWLRSVDWGAIATKIKAFFTEVDRVVTALGGWERVSETLLALWVGSKALGMIASLTRVVGLLTTIPGAGTVAGVLLRILAGGGGLLTALLAMWPRAANANERADLDQRGILPRGGEAPPLTADEQEQRADPFMYFLRGVLPEWAGGRPAQPQAPVTPPSISSDTDVRASADFAMHYLRQHGKSAEQAAAIVANLQRESNFSLTHHPGDGDHYGWGQWDAERRLQIMQGTGINVVTAGPEQQLQAVLWELANTQGVTNAALDANLTDPRAGGVAFSRFYERHGNPAEDQARGDLAEMIWRRSRGLPYIGGAAPPAAAPAPPVGAPAVPMDAPAPAAPVPAAPPAPPSPPLSQADQAARDADRVNRAGGHNIGFTIPTDGPSWTIPPWLRDAFQGGPAQISAQLALPPSPSASLARDAQLAAAQAGVTNNRTITASSETNINGPIAVHTAATDARGVARGLGDALRDYQFASGANFGLL